MSSDAGDPARAKDLVVIDALKAWTCTGCGSSRGGDLLLMQDAGPICLACADLDHLVFLPSGDTALTRRARKASSLSAVVVRLQPDASAIRAAGRARR